MTVLAGLPTFKKPAYQFGVKNMTEQSEMIHTIWVVTANHVNSLKLKVVELHWTVADNEIENKTFLINSQHP